MNIKITKGLETQRKKEIKEAYIASHTIRERLRSVLHEELDDSIKAMSKQVSFESPAWSEHQAFRLGEQEAIRKVIALLED